MNKKRYGYRRIALELRNKGYIVNHKKVKRLMSIIGLYVKTPKVKCNEIWSTDVSKFHMAVGKLYLLPVLELHNREIVSFNISTTPNFEQTKDMLNKAFEKMKNGYEYTFEILDHLKSAMEEYIDYYNNQRITTK
ncbi:transposase [Thomasclavelia spiroformis]|uniref:transposase n=1 Tax=Thomasclavelia spiroformis TaxID=29348 RepID=UPI003C6FF289